MASVGRFLAVAPAYRSKEAIPEVLLKTLSPESLPHGKAEQHMVGVYALGPDDLIDIPDQPLSIGLSLKPQWSPSVQWEQKGKCQEKEHWTWESGAWVPVLALLSGFMSQTRFTILAPAFWSLMWG